ncbi:MAG: DUF4398 domain-containing protein [Spirochaetaceae bacterium]|jgi:flagellar biosynthesis/type III secretory pathway protein FliH|nr:DUF4398 domain-containing protein [Spirochaetaceae bacterium]
MEKKAVMLVGSILIIVFIAGGCAELPQEEMDEAVAAVTQAENDPNAVLYGELALSRATTALSRMREEASAKRYQSAKNLAQDAIKAAAQARADGRTGAARAQDEARQALSEVQDLMAETERNLETAKNLGNLDANFDALGELLANAQGTVADAETDFSEGNYRESQEKCRAARFTLNGINGDLSKAVQKTSRKK